MWGHKANGTGAFLQVFSNESLSERENMIDVITTSAKEKGMVRERKQGGRDTRVFAQELCRVVPQTFNIH
jgi:hypothetical protein